MDSGITSTTTARSGRMLRFVVGQTSLPSVPFFAPDAPKFSADASVALDLASSSFALKSNGSVALRGRAGAAPFELEIDVGDADIYGFGAHTGRATKNGSRFKLMTLDTIFFEIEGASYTAMPFFIARSPSTGACVGVLLATTFPLDVVVDHGVVSMKAACDVEGSALDVVVFTGTAAEIVRDLASLVGRTFLPPAWALGFHQSRWSYKTSDEVLSVARRFRSEELPADVVHLDIHYMNDFRVFTFHPERFAQPKKMHDELRALGFRTMAIIDPGVSAVPYPVYDAVTSGDMLLKHKDGSAYTGKVWPGATVFPDFAQEKVRDAWGKFHEPLVDAGISGFWNDMNDPVLKVAEVYDPLAEDIRHKDGSHARFRNVYANGMAEATRTGLQHLRPGVRPFVLTRSGFLGIQRNAAVWTGDNHSTWAHLRENVDMALNLSLSGVPIVGADVGGFGRGPGKYGAVKWRPPVELFVRWMELGSLMPFYRVHCTLYAPRQEPWSFGRRALDVSRTVLRRRYRLLPYLYAKALEAHETGLPIVRPLWLQHDVKCDDEFLVGDALLVAPILERNAGGRSVVLPAGSWIDWHTGAVLAGGRTIDVEAPWGRTPIFVRAGALLFTAEPKRNAEETLRSPIALDVTTPTAGTKGAGTLFLDDGESESKRFVIDVESEDLGGRLKLAFKARVDSFKPEQTEIELRAPRAFTTAIVDGVRKAMEPRAIAEEERRSSASTVRIPIGVREIILE